MRRRMEEQQGCDNARDLQDVQCALCKPPLSITLPRLPSLDYQNLSDAEVLHTYFTLPYVGKPVELDDKVVKYYVTRTNDYIKYLVTQFIMYNDIDGCNISMDRYFTSVALAEWALTQNFIIVGTMKLDWKEIPKELRLVRK